MEQMHPPVRRLEDVLRPVRRASSTAGENTVSFIGNLGSGAVLVVRRASSDRRVELQVVGEATDTQLEELRTLAQANEQAEVSIARAGSRRR